MLWRSMLVVLLMAVQLISALDVDASLLLRVHRTLSSSEGLRSQFRTPPPSRFRRNLQYFSTNGINVRAVVKGDGPVVVMLHGLPEGWTSFIYQINPVVSAGYKVVVPDVRGYGGSDKPDEVEAYTMVELVKDVVGLLDALEADKAILVGHDWGSLIAYTTALLYPDRVEGVIGMSVPARFAKVGEVPFSELISTIYPDSFYFQSFFGQEGSEDILDNNVREALLDILYVFSADIGAEAATEALFGAPEPANLLDRVTPPRGLRSIPWEDPRVFSYLVREFR